LLGAIMLKLLLAFALVCCTVAGKQSDMVEVTDDNLDEMLFERDWLFFNCLAPEHEQCRRLAPTMQKVATELKARNVGVGFIDASMWPDVAGRFRLIDKLNFLNSLPFGPALALVPNQTLHQWPYRFKGSQDPTVEDIVQFATTEVEDKLAKPIFPAAEWHVKIVWRIVRWILDINSFTIPSVVVFLLAGLIFGMSCGCVIGATLRQQELNQEQAARIKADKSD